MYGKIRKRHEGDDGESGTTSTTAFPIHTSSGGSRVSTLFRMMVATAMFIAAWFFIFSHTFTVPALENAPLRGMVQVSNGGNPSDPLSPRKSQPPAGNMPKPPEASVSAGISARQLPVKEGESSSICGMVLTYFGVGHG